MRALWLSLFVGAGLFAERIPRAELQLTPELLWIPAELAPGPASSRLGFRHQHAAHFLDSANAASEGSLGAHTAPNPLSPEGKALVDGGAGVVRIHEISEDPK
jgi:hypothetical protein